MPLSVAVRTAPVGGDIRLLDGDGRACTRSTASARTARSRAASRRSERGALLRREALELALYTFRYLDDVDMVVGAAAAAAAEEGRSADGDAQRRRAALFFRPGDLRPELEVPLDATIAAGDAAAGDDRASPRRARSTR